MHEVSLVNSIFRSIELEFPKQDVERVRGIFMRVGLLSNVEPVLMQSAFAAVIETESAFRQATLHVEVLPILVHCAECDKTSLVENYKFVCACGKPSNNIVQGTELLIHKVEFALDDD
ncbi:MAG: hydrogenase maturation nickel metallochaperone HypA [Candidatus Kapabacteria bacterium]|jgi:hydrogenase nickel incorporation protein HypA/HybF|nr:hydrogenase maturation nickel metallochaperone HypA [Candidatus Kapabacteria bacterium]